MANGVTTLWDDIQAELGNYLPAKTETHQSEYTKDAIDALENQDKLKKKNLDELDELEDEIDEEILNIYREKRLKEIKELESQPRYGTVREINKQDYVSEVTNCEQDVYVVLHLHQDYVEPSTLLSKVFIELAKKHIYTKFLITKADRCIEKFPDSKVPTVIVYKNGNLIYCWERIDRETGRFTIKNVELFLKYNGILPKDPNDQEDEDELKANYYKNITTKTYQERKILRKNNDSDSEDELKENISNHIRKF